MGVVLAWEKGRCKERRGLAFLAAQHGEAEAGGGGCGGLSKLDEVDNRLVRRAYFLEWSCYELI